MLRLDGCRRRGQAAADRIGDLWLLRQAVPRPTMAGGGVEMRLVRALLIALLSATLMASAVYVLVVRPRIRSWGVDPAEAELELPGDDLLPEPSHTETRGITIDAPPAKIWPWLVQMGYGRAGWYSYDTLDNEGPSTSRILPEFQELKAGDIMPTHPGGGFKVEVVEPERALVLYMDTELVRSQAATATEEGESIDDAAPGVRMSGAMLGASYPEIAASWAFYLQPAGDGRTRLIERFRARTPGGSPAHIILGEIMGTGIVLMTRKQMLGIKERVEAEDVAMAAEAPAEAPSPAEAPAETAV
jgi:hypothetical protein